MARLVYLLMLCVAATTAASETGAAGDGRMVNLRTAYQTQFEAYLAGPREAAAGVLLVPDRWGLNREVKDWADRVAGLGFRVLAIDLYDGRSPRDAQSAHEIWRSIDPVWIEADLDAGLTYLRQAQGRIIVSGFGKGGAVAGELAARHPGAVDALVTYYDSETLVEGDRPGKLAVPVLDILTPRSLAGPPAATLPLSAVTDAWRATEQFLSRFVQ